MQLKPQPEPDRNGMSRKVAWTFLGFTALGLLNFGYRYLDDLARQHPNTFAIRMFEELTGAYAGLLLFPFFLWVVRRLRMRRDNWWRMLPLNLLMLVVLSICDTTMMSFSRHLLAPAFGLGPYDYGIMFYRYPMEFAQHLLLFGAAAVIIYGSHAIVYWLQRIWKRGWRKRNCKIYDCNCSPTFSSTLSIRSPR
jgi:hypothetical protein